MCLELRSESQMDMREFEAVLTKYGLPVDNTYEDLSEVGSVLWHNGRDLAIKVACEANRRPKLLFVAMTSDGNYEYLESALEELSGSDIAAMLGYVRKHAEAIRKDVGSMERLLCIPANGRELVFTRV
jgi:hypothetical protein